MANVIKFPNRSAVRGFVETPTARDILRLAKYCQDYGDLGLICGPPGAGKTTALKYYANTTERARYVSVNPSAGAVAAALALVCEVFDAPAPPMRARMHEVLCDRIAVWGTGGELLLIDEAQHLNDQAIDQLRCVHDDTGLAIVFAGNATFKTRFNNTKVAAFAQFTSRIGARLVLGNPSADDVAALCGERGIAGASELAWLNKRAEGPGGLRIVAKLIRAAGNLVRGPGAIRLEHLKAAANMLGV